MAKIETAIVALPGRHVPFPLGPHLARLRDAIVAAGGTPLAVGGAVRDHLLGRPAKDVDVEVHGLALEALERALGAFDVHAVGRSFGVLKVAVELDGARVTFDVALPRRESKMGRGHKGFVVESDPSMPFADAAARRDFTMNAMGIDLRDLSLLDPHGGARDLTHGVLRHVSEAFDEDPLRVLRGCQLAARFGLEIAHETLARCRALRGELPTLPAERLLEEMKKLCGAEWPSIGLNALRATEALSLFPELAALIGCPQEPEWHPEGDVWIHTLMVVDEAAQLSREQGLGADDGFLLVMAALCHDLGKPPMTVFENGRVRSKDHDVQGEPPTRAFLARIAAPHAFVEEVVALVREHLKPYALWRERATLSDGAIRRLALRVHIPRLVLVSRADSFGRTTPEAIAREDPAGEWLLEQAARLAVADAAPAPVLKGRHLLARGLPAGKAMGTLLAEAFEAQLEGRFSDEEGGLRWLDERMQRERIA